MQDPVVDALDADGFKTEARTVNVQFEADHTSPGVLKHLPGKINIRPFCGFIYYPEKVKLCNCCGCKRPCSMGMQHP